LVLVFGAGVGGWQATGGVTVSGWWVVGGGVVGVAVGGGVVGTAVGGGVVGLAVGGCRWRWLAWQWWVVLVFGFVCVGGRQRVTRGGQQAGEMGSGGRW